MINKYKKENRLIKNKNFFLGCNMEISGPIFEEFLKRFFSPIFIVLIALSSSLILLKNKDQERYKLNAFMIFCLSVLIIIVSEISLRYSSVNIQRMFLYAFFPIIFFVIIYSYIFIKHKKIN